MIYRQGEAGLVGALKGRRDKEKKFEKVLGKGLTSERKCGILQTQQRKGDNTMDWKTVRQCEYRGYTITDTGAGFWIHRPNGTSMGETWNVDDAMEWIDKDLEA